MKGTTLRWLSTALIMPRGSRIPVITGNRYLPTSVRVAPSFDFDNGVQTIQQGTYLLTALDQTLPTWASAFLTRPQVFGIPSCCVCPDGRYCGSASLSCVSYRTEVRDARISAGCSFISILYLGYGRCGIRTFEPDRRTEQRLRDGLQNVLLNKKAIDAVRAEGGDAARMPCAGNWFSGKKVV